MLWAGWAAKNLEKRGRFCYGRKFVRRRGGPQTAFNAVNRGVYIADNLDFLRAINTGSVDLVCIDPPFAKNDTFTGDKLKPPLSKAEAANEKRLLKQRWGIATPEQADAAGIAWPDDPKSRGGYKDQWSWEQDIHEDWVDGIKATHPAVNMLIEATREIHGDGIAAYLAFMAIRLFEIHRVLKPTGSLFLHCDHTASGYLRQLMDGVFGRDNFRNEIVWCYTGPSNTKRWFPRKHDTILFYAKGEDCKFNRENLYVPYVRLSGTGHNSLSRGGRSDAEVRRLEAEYGERGKVVEDYWVDIPGGGHTPKAERTGYPTQKPIALAERIIQASTNPGDVVLNCFAGCAYAAVAAEKLGRQWAACDINPRAWTVFKRQFNKGGDLPLLTCNDRTTGQQVMGSEPTVTVHGPGELPERTTSVEVEVKPLRATAQRAKATPQYKRASTLLNRQEMLEALLRFSGGRAWCCGFTSFDTEGKPILANYELDHITPKSKGGEDEITNRAPLCPAHNGMKSDLDISLYELREIVIFRRQLAEGITPQALPKLEEALREARHIHAEAYQRKHGKPLGI